MSDFSDILTKINALKSFDTKSEVVNIVTENKEQIVKLEKEQLLQGRDITGEYLRPLYSEDPYFKSKQSAARYAKWKAKLFPDYDKPVDVPNLIINGAIVHNPMKVDVSNDTFNIHTDSGLGNRIISDYNVGLDPEQCAVMANETVLPAFKKEFKNKTGFDL